METLNPVDSGHVIIYHLPFPNRYFYVTVDEADTIYPVVINHGFELLEGGRAVLTTDFLSSEDINRLDITELCIFNLLCFDYN